VSAPTMKQHKQKTEKQGRWSKDEHAIFLRGIDLYGKDWKKIAALVQSRTVIQVRTHAQKYFLKIEKDKEKKTSAPTTSKEVDGNVSTPTHKEVPEVQIKKMKLEMAPYGLVDLPNSFDNPTTPKEKKTELDRSSIKVNVNDRKHTYSVRPSPVSVAEEIFPPTPPSHQNVEFYHFPQHAVEHSRVSMETDALFADPFSSTDWQYVSSSLDVSNSNNISSATHFLDPLNVHYSYPTNVPEAVHPQPNDFEIDLETLELLIDNSMD